MNDFEQELTQWCIDNRFTNRFGFNMVIDQFAKQAGISKEVRDSFKESIFQCVLRAFNDTRLYFTPRNVTADGILIDGIKRGIKIIVNAWREWEDECYPESVNCMAVKGHLDRRSIAITVAEEVDGYTYANISTRSMPGARTVSLRLDVPRRGQGELFEETK